MKAGRSNPPTWLDPITETWTGTQNMNCWMTKGRKCPRPLWTPKTSSKRPLCSEVLALSMRLQLRKEFGEEVLPMRRQFTRTSPSHSRIWCSKVVEIKGWHTWVPFRSVDFDLFCSVVNVLTNHALNIPSLRFVYLVAQGRVFFDFFLWWGTSSVRGLPNCSCQADSVFCFSSLDSFDVNNLFCTIVILTSWTLSHRCCNKRACFCRRLPHNCQWCTRLTRHQI